MNAKLNAAGHYQAMAVEVENEKLRKRVQEFEAQLSAIGAGGVEPLRKPVTQPSRECLQQSAASVICYVRPGATLPERMGWETCAATDAGALAVHADSADLQAAPPAPAGVAVPGLADRVRPGVEAAPWVCAAIAKQDAELECLRAALAAPAQPLTPAFADGLLHSTVLHKLWEESEPTAQRGQPGALAWQLGVFAGRVARAAAAPAQEHATQLAGQGKEPSPPTAVTGPIEWPATCDGLEQEAWEAWARVQRFDMSEHPMHYLFLHKRTDAARQGWKAGLVYAVEQMKQRVHVVDAAPAQAQEDARDGLTQAARDVLAERARQIGAEGYEPEADDGYESGELAAAAATYALLATGAEGWRVEDHWPWSVELSLKKGEPRRMMVKSAALSLAEIERFDRAAARAAQGVDCQDCAGMGYQDGVGDACAPCAGSGRAAAQKGGA